MYLVKITFFLGALKASDDQKLYRRLELLEEEILPAEELKVWEVVIVDSDGEMTPTGIRTQSNRRYHAVVPCV